MRDIKLIILHCTATPQTTKIDSILNYWKNTLGWKSPGYHYIIESDGKITQLQDESKPANGVVGQNAHSIHISYIGGIDKTGKALDNRTVAQLGEQISLIKKLLIKYPHAKVAGHNQFTKMKACPSFNVPFFCDSIGLSERNIYRIPPIKAK
jgi:N-acetylmuramoyl-L-alanine amidase